MEEAEDAPWQLNTGTWTPILQQAFDRFADREWLTFVRVTPCAENSTVDTQLLLLVWNDAAGPADPMLAIADRTWPATSPGDQAAPG